MRRAPTDKKKTQRALKFDTFTAICKSKLGEECEKEYRFHPTRRWRFDYAIPKHRIAIEVEGGIWSNGRHIRPKGFLGDMEKYNQAAAFGWKVIRVTPESLYAKATLDLIQEARSQS